MVAVVAVQLVLVEGGGRGVVVGEDVGVRALVPLVSGVASSAAVVVVVVVVASAVIVLVATVTTVIIVVIIVVVAAELRNFSRCNVTSSSSATS